MRIPVQVIFLGMPPSEAVEARVHDKAAALERYAGELTSCRVTIDATQRHRHQGHPIAVRIDVTLPRQELAVDRVQDEDVYVALRDAFDALRRRLEDHQRQVRGDVKVHAEPVNGTVQRLEAAERRGFIRDEAGDEYWFGPENVVGVAWDRLEEGAEVHFLPEVAGEGRQAKRVSPGHHGAR